MPNFNMSPVMATGDGKADIYINGWLVVFYAMPTTKVHQWGMARRNKQL